MKNNIIKSLVALALATCLMAACGKGRKCSTTVNEPCQWCEVSNPVKDLAWLNEYVDNNCYLFGVRVYVCRMNDGRQAFFIISPIVDDSYELLYNCKGELIGKRGGLAGIAEGDWDIDWGSTKIIYESIPDVDRPL